MQKVSNLIEEISNSDQSNNNNIHNINDSNNDKQQ